MKLEKYYEFTLITLLTAVILTTAMPPCRCKAKEHEQAVKTPRWFWSWFFPSPTTTPAPTTMVTPLLDGNLPFLVTIPTATTIMTVAKPEHGDVGPSEALKEPSSTVEFDEESMKNVIWDIDPRLNLRVV